MKKGFTLIEMIVAVAIFTVVMIITIGTYLNVDDIQKKATALRIVNDNVNFVLEIMTRELRSGQNYSSCTDCDSINFINKDGESIIYYLDSADNSIKRNNGVDIIRLTSPNVAVENLTFNVKQGGAPFLQPLVTILVKASAGEKIKIKNVLNVQVSVSKRELGS
ncbi:type II secretion system GspH family protein [Patescibacteria group bacterium]|nr:type II secretion system GspH family protein [Patescibacteria group bacterium]